MRTAQIYLEKLAGMTPNIYLDGKAIGSYPGYHI